MKTLYCSFDLKAELLERTICRTESERVLDNKELRKMVKKKTSWCYRSLRRLVKLIYGNIEIIGMENLPEKDAVLVGNHTQMNGPIVGEIFMPENSYIWCAGQMMNRKEVPEYAFTDFWSQKPKWTLPFYRMLSHAIAPLASFIFNNARTIAVYHDMRIAATFKETIKMLKNGANMIIFPEKDEKRNNIIYQFQDKFVDVARFYYKKTGIRLTFVPMYVAPKLKKVYIGQGIRYDNKNSAEEERSRVCEYLADEITKIARELPEHTVVPYRNIPKKKYLTNKDICEVPE